MVFWTYNIAAFPYEIHLQKLKKLVRKPERPLAQIFRRLSAQKIVGQMPNTLKKAHFVGPIPDGLASKGVQGQYSQITTEQWTIKVSTGDNVFFIADDICMIDNTVECHDGIYVISRTFLYKSIFLHIHLAQTS